MNKLKDFVFPVCLHEEHDLEGLKRILSHYRIGLHDSSIHTDMFLFLG